MKLHIFDRRGHFTVVVLGLMFSITLSLFTILFSGSKSDAKDIPYIYKSIRIEDGDTLDNIASRFLADSGMLRHSDFVREISRVNRLSSDNIISGAYLVIPFVDSY